MHFNTFMSKHIYMGLLLLVGIVSSCGSSNDNVVRFRKEPLDELIKKHSNSLNFSIVLYDLDYNESKDAYFHQYRILFEPPNQDTLLEEVTDWEHVSDVFFDKHKDNMGMEIASKKDGVLKKIASPPGYSNYVGNEKYGHWKKNDDGTSFWEFYGKYAFMSSMFRMAFYPIYYSGWYDYRTNYYRNGRPYYGRMRDGMYDYGTRSRYSQKEEKDRGSSSRWNSRSSSFKSKVRNKVQKSASASRERTARRNKTASKRRAATRSSSRSRSSSRYGGSSSRSRAGGYGK